MHGFKGTMGACRYKKRAMMAKTDFKNTRDLVLIVLHVVFALFLLVLSFLLHGRIPGMSADESAALGFLLFFGVGLPMFLFSIAFFAISLLAGGRFLGMLAMAMFVTFMFAVFNKWTGLAASLAYLAFALWVLVRMLKDPGRLTTGSRENE